MPDEISRGRRCKQVVRPRFRMGLKPTALLRHAAKVRLAWRLAQNDTGRDAAEWGRGTSLGRGTRQPRFPLAFTTCTPHVRCQKLRRGSLPPYGYPAARPPIRRTFEVPKSRGEVAFPRRGRLRLPCLGYSRWQRQCSESRGTVAPLREGGNKGGSLRM